MDASLGQLEPKCLFKVQYLNNRFFAFSVQFLSIMRRSSRKCAVVTDHKKLIATLSHKNRAFRGAWNILNGVLKGPTQGGEKWVIPKNHIAYYLKKLKEEGVCIEMEVNAPQPEEPQRTRDQGTGPQGGQPHGRLPDPPARAARPGPHSTDPARHPHLTAPPSQQPATLRPTLRTTTQARLTSTDPPRHNARPRHTAPQRATVQHATARRDATRHRAAQHGTTDPNLKD